MTAAFKHVTHAVRRNNPRQSMARKGARLVRCELNLRRGIVGVNVRVHTCGDNLSSLQHTTQGFSAWDRRPHYLVTTQYRDFIARTDGRTALVGFLGRRIRWRLRSRGSTSITARLSAPGCLALLGIRRITLVSVVREQLVVIGHAGLVGFAVTSNWALRLHRSEVRVAEFAAVTPLSRDGGLTICHSEGRRSRLVRGGRRRRSNTVRSAPPQSKFVRAPPVVLSVMTKNRVTFLSSTMLYVDMTCQPT